MDQTRLKRIRPAYISGSCGHRREAVVGGSTPDF
jgi:hypothetical protein